MAQSAAGPGGGVADEIGVGNDQLGALRVFHGSAIVGGIPCKSAESKVEDGIFNLNCSGPAV